MISGLNTYVRVGRIEFPRIPEIEIISERHRPLTRMNITVPDPAGMIYRAVKNRDAVSIILGYRAQEPALWEGTVQGKTVDQNKDQVRISVIGRDRSLAEVLIKQSFLRETPEAIVKYAIELSGFKAGRIDPIGVTFPRFVAGSISAWQVARQCEHTLKKAYGFDMSPWAFWQGKDGKVNWHAGDEQTSALPVIESGNNLIRHSPEESTVGLNSVETFMLPYMMHSMLFKIRDHKRQIEGDFKALKVRHIFKNSQARSFIEYGEEYERY